MLVLSLLSAVQGCLSNKMAHGYTQTGSIQGAFCFLFFFYQLGGLDRLCPMFSVLSAVYQSLLLTCLEEKQHQ